MELFNETLKTNFSASQEISKKQLWDFYQTKEKISETTFNWRIHELVKQGFLERVGWGRYRLGIHKAFAPILHEKQHQAIYDLIEANFKYSRFCIWHTSNLNEFHLHLRGKHHLFVEIESASIESAFELLSKHFEHVFLNPDSLMMERYVLAHPETIIIKPLVFQAPIQKIENKWTISIEKLIVDIYFEKLYFSMEQETEQHYIFQEVFNRYSINQNRLMQYARRRLKDKKAVQFKEWITYIQTNPYHD